MYIASLKYIPSVLQLSILIHLFEMSNSVWRTQKWNVYQYEAKGINSKIKQNQQQKKEEEQMLEKLKWLVSQERVILHWTNSEVNKTFPPGTVLGFLCAGDWPEVDYNLWKSHNF